MEADSLLTLSPLAASSRTASSTPCLQGCWPIHRRGTGFLPPELANGVACLPPWGTTIRSYSIRKRGREGAWSFGAWGSLDTCSGSSPEAEVRAKTPPSWKQQGRERNKDQWPCRLG